MHSRAHTSFLRSPNVFSQKSKTGEKKKKEALQLKQGTQEKCKIFLIDFPSAFQKKNYHILKAALLESFTEYKCFCINHSP